MEQQDQLLDSWLLSSMTEGVLTRMVGCDSTSQIWSKLIIYFAAQTRAKISQLKLILQNVKKKSLSINDFLSKIKNVIDRLVSVVILLILLITLKLFSMVSRLSMILLLFQLIQD